MFLGCSLVPVVELGATDIEAKKDAGMKKTRTMHEGIRMEK